MKKQVKSGPQQSEKQSVKLISVDARLLQALLDYLVTRPYAEVFPYVEAIRSLGAQPSQPEPSEEASTNGAGKKDKASKESSPVNA